MAWLQLRDCVALSSQRLATGQCQGDMLLCSLCVIAWHRTLILGVTCFCQRNIPQGEEKVVLYSSPSQMVGPSLSET